MMVVLPTVPNQVVIDLAGCTLINVAKMGPSVGSLLSLGDWRAKQARSSVDIDVRQPR
jgi:hypothetical protein